MRNDASACHLYDDALVIADEARESLARAKAVVAFAGQVLARFDRAQ